jgi:ABC-type multidrug transport system ATPase subunit
LSSLFFFIIFFDKKAPPGHGKTSLLRAAAGQLVPESGSIQLNGVPLGRLEMTKLAALVEQDDVLLPQLTVRETLQFAANATTTSHGLSAEPLVSEFASERVAIVLGMLGLERCADTQIGSDMVRGISGGEKRRTVLGEQLVSNARCLFLDEFSTGLDSATTIAICKDLRTWTRVTKA